MADVGLVLGAGGVVGQAYHAGVLAALEHDLGWDPRHAEVVVGTSAGAITAALLRLGTPAGDLAAWTVKAPLSVEGAHLAELFGADPPDLEPLGLRHVLRVPRPPTPALISRALLRPWQFRPLAAAVTLMAPGRHDIAEHLAALRQVEGPRWPRRQLWVCAVRRLDGRRVVFGREGSPPAPLHLAVAASCAIPGYFAPVEIGGRAYVDGGAHSLTNAAVLRRRRLDLVVVVSPMSAPARIPTSVNGLLQQHAHRRLQMEVRALEAAGIPVVIFEPGPTEQEAMGHDLLSRARLDEVVLQSFLGAGARMADPAVRPRLTPILRRRGGDGTGGGG